MQYYPLPLRLGSICDVYGALLTTEDLDRIEKLTSYTFESSFRDFMGTTSGGRFDYVKFFREGQEELAWFSVLDFRNPVMDRRAREYEVENFFHVCEDSNFRFFKKRVSFIPFGTAEYVGKGVPCFAIEGFLTFQANGKLKNSVWFQSKHPDYKILLASGFLDFIKSCMLA
jgi:hypothetical protein